MITTRAALALVGVTLAPAVGSLAVMRAQQTRQAAPTPLVFDGVTVIDVEQGRRLPAQRVVVVGTRIRTVGSVSAVPLPVGARVVDARGKYLIPGLWDMHTHSERENDFSIRCSSPMG
jgi:imidazolonepropionase-like amidohydrolase